MLGFVHALDRRRRNILRRVSRRSLAAAAAGSIGATHLTFVAPPQGDQTTLVPFVRLNVEGWQKGDALRYQH